MPIFTDTLIVSVGDIAGGVYSYQNSGMGRESLSVELELPLSCQLEVLAAVSFTCI